VRDIITNVRTDYSCQALMKRDFAIDFQKILEFHILWKSV